MRVKIFLVIILIPWTELSNHNKIRQSIGRIISNMHSMADLETGNEFTIPGRIKHSPDFNTSNGKANLAIVEAVDARPERRTFQFDNYSFRRTV